jgi:predicted membrane protein
MKKPKPSWEEIRRKGQARYIIVQGLLCWGVCIGILEFLVGYLADFGLSVEFLVSERAQKLMKLSTISGIIFGLGIGALSWRWREKQSPIADQSEE